MKTRVYIVDDHAMVRRGLVSILQGEADLEVCGEAADCATATSEIYRLKPEVAIVDISLRGNSGIELIKNIKAFNAAIQVIVLSVHDEAIYALRAIKAGARAYVMKQESAGKVIEAIRRTREGKLYVSDQVAGHVLKRLVKGSIDPEASPVERLSDRELEVATLIGAGLATREVASRLHVSVKTVETHRAHIKTKASLSTSNQLVQFCVAWVESEKRASL